MPRTKAFAQSPLLWWLLAGVSLGCSTPAPYPRRPEAPPSAAGTPLPSSSRVLVPVAKDSSEPQSLGPSATEAREVLELAAPDSQTVDEFEAEDEDMICLRLYTPDVKPMTTAAYRWDLGERSEAGVTQNGWVKITCSGTCPALVHLSWGPAVSPGAGRGSPLPYESDIETGFARGTREQQAERMLSNLGYSGTVERQVRQFQRDQRLFELGLVDGKIPEVTWWRIKQRFAQLLKDPSVPADCEEPGVAFGTWVSSLSQALETTATPGIDAGFADFAARHGLATNDPRLLRDYRHLVLLYEAVRDGGFWHVLWEASDRDPSSRGIWRAFIDQTLERDFSAPAAIASGAESSALLGTLARRLAIYDVGLFHPTPGHTVAAWAPLEGREPKTPIVLLPTSQEFLGCKGGFDDTPFATARKSIERYPGWDIRDTTTMPKPRADWLTSQLRIHAAASTNLLALLRAKRTYVMHSNPQACDETRAALSAAVGSPLSDGDRTVLRIVGRRELGWKPARAEDVLSWLGSSNRTTQ
jgi:hypothetical protein